MDLNLQPIWYFYALIAFHNSSVGSEHVVPGMDIIKLWIENFLYIVQTITVPKRAAAALDTKSTDLKVKLYTGSQRGGGIGNRSSGREHTNLNK